MLFQAQLYYKILRVVERLNMVKGANFLINLNVQSSFLNIGHSVEEELFGFKEEQMPTYHHDLLTINNFFDTSFLRMPGNNEAYLVISANLTPSYRKTIAEEMLRIMDEELAYE